MATLRSADQEQLQKLLLGQLPTAEVERLATEYADDSRLAELVESLAGSDDALLHLLHNHETAVVDPEGERLVERLVQRLKPALPVLPKDDTAAMNRADVTTEPSSPAATGQTQKLPERLEYYRPIKVLGQGGMGTVYLAEDTRLGREVAIKTLRPELAINPQAKERFLREARSAAKLEHDHIIPIYSVGEADGTPFLAMPFLKGEPLDALIRRTAGPLPVATAVRLAREMASGLAAAHARGLIHRDIKPANIWIEAPIGRVKILDFGLAKAADAGGDADSETNLTASGAIVGTPAYMAPEQASGHAVDGRADLFSLGCVLYELLSGKRAFSGPNTMSILMSLANHMPPAPDKLSAQCPAALSRLVMQLLAKDPANRPASAEAVIQALAELDTVSDQVSRAASAPGLLPNTATVRGLTPPGSPTLVEIAPFNQDFPSGDTIALSLATPARKPSVPKRRVAIALAGVLMMLLAAVVFRIQTDQGTLVVTIDDPAVQAILDQDGLVIRDKGSDRTWTIKATEKQKLLPSGKYELDGKQNLQLLVTDDSGAEVTTDEFTLKRKGERRVRVVLEQASNVAEKNSTKPTQSDPDRRAAEYVLSIGGGVTIKEKYEERDVPTVGDLPRKPFEFTRAQLTWNEAATDSGLASFQDCKNLTHVEFCGAKNVGDVGLAYLRNCKNITHLHLASTKVTDEGLATFKHCKKLEYLELLGCNVGDEGLAHFQDCPNLGHLGLGITHASDAGLTYFKQCQKLTHLGLHYTQVSDAGLAHFKDCNNLKLVSLMGTKVSDAGLVDLANWPNLRDLPITKTKVTEAGVKKLSAALPGCRIEWDGGVIEPTVSPDRRAAEWVRSIGSGITIKENGQERQLWDAASKLPPTAFELTTVFLVRNPKVNDAGLANFEGCKNLTVVDLAVTSVSDAGLGHFKDCQNLTALDLSHTQVSDVGLAFFADCKNLTVLSMSNTRVTDAGLVHFKDCKKLTFLGLNLTQVSDVGVAHFKNCPNLATLYLGDTRVTDAGLVHFKNCKQLKHLSLDRLPVTDTGLAIFTNCKELTHLDLNNTKVSDAGLVQFRDCKNLTILELIETGISDAGLAHFNDCNKLDALYLTGTHVTDVGLAHFHDCGDLITIQLSGTQVTDVGLEPFANCPKLRTVHVEKTKVTEAAVKKLSAALPECKIEWDGGVIEPSKTANPK